MVCTHPQREAIERELLGGKGPVEVARTHKVSKNSVRRHRDMHLLYRPDAYRRSGPDAAMVGLRGFSVTVVRPRKKK
jgi:hypothetical protein